LNFNHTLLLVNDFHQRQFPVQHIWLILCHAPNEDETIAKLKDLHYLQDQSAAFDGIQLLRLSKRADARLIAPPAFLGASRIALLPQRVFAPAQSLVRALRIIPARLAIR
jgi:hypothetical protein